MLVGHTKFSPDWCFGLFKQRYRRTFVSCLDDIAKVVDVSADVNVAQMVGTQSGEPVVPMYNWATFLGGHFRTVPQLKQHQHFMFSAQHPGVVTMKQFSDSASTTFSMLVDHEWHPTELELPPVISPVGLSCTRQWYLYKQIRAYCREGTADLTCPKPSTPLHGCESPQPSEEEDDDGRGVALQPKRARRCGKCGRAGHRRRTCQDK